MDTSINNASELKAEIARLKMIEEEQSHAIKARFNTPSALFHTIVSIFPKSPEGKGGFFNQDIFGLLSRIVLPLTLNKTIFRNSNFLIKTLVGFLSQKASHLVNEDVVTGAWDKVKSLFEKKKPADYGIPPDSEAS
ncbi:MAG TPA: hypothetical protein VGN20_04005 [Mucilaginibacter sp.]